jgi:hypothetical protein
MALQTAGGTGFAPAESYMQIRVFAQSAKASAQGMLTTLQAGNVNSVWVFSLLDQLNGFISAMNGWKAIAGLDAYATAQGYTGSISTDATACVTAAQACINWIVTNFPKDSTNTFILDFTLNADGSRTPRSFTPAQTAGLQTAISAFIATVS